VLSLLFGGKSAPYIHLMDAEKIERRLRRLDAALARTERRLGTLLEVRNYHERRFMVALANAEAAQDAFVLAARVAFRDPYRALKAWERHEFRLSKLTLAEPQDADVAAGAHAAVSNSTGLAGLTLRGRTILGRDDPERTAARAALEKMGEQRRAWLDEVRAARTYGHAVNQVGEQVRELRDRLRSGVLRRDDLWQALREAHDRPRTYTVPPSMTPVDEADLAQRGELYRAYGDIIEGRQSPERNASADAPMLTPEERARRERDRLARLYNRARGREGDLDR